MELAYRAQQVSQILNTRLLLLFNFTLRYDSGGYLPVKLSLIFLVLYPNLISACFMLPSISMSKNLFV